jgi:hypothetical protein
MTRSLAALAKTGDWRALEAELVKLTGEPMVARPSRDLAGLAEIATVTGKPRTTIKSALQRAKDGPQPLFNLAATPVWSAGELGTWLSTRVISFGGRKPKVKVEDSKPARKPRATKPKAVALNGAAEATGSLTAVAPRAKPVEAAPRRGQVFVP